MSPWLAQALWLATAMAVLAFAVWHDARSMRIPNGTVATCAAAGLLLAALPHGIGWANALLGVAVGLAVFFPLYVFGVMGAGDVKLLAALGALTGYPGILHLALFTAAAGGAVAIAWWLYSGCPRLSLHNLAPAARARPQDLPAAGVGPAPELPSTSARVPYAIAIALGMVAFVFLVRRPG